MISVVAFVAAAAIRCCAADDSVTTSLLLPDGLFITDENFPKPTFVGQVTVTKSTTWYTLDCSAGGAASFFTAGDDDNSYTFYANVASTQYLVENYGYSVESGANMIEDIPETTTTTINCNPLGTSGSATCTTSYEDDGENTSTDPATDANCTTNIESSLYTVFFTEAAGYSAASTSAAPSPASSAPTAKPTTMPSSKPPSASHLAPSTKIAIGLGAPLGACAGIALALLLYRHGKHKERSRMTQMGNLPPPPPPTAVASGSEGKRFSDAGVAGQTMGRSPPVYSMEMQG